MNERERLIELLQNWGNKENDGVRAESIADYLLENGVVVSPVKVGDVVYYVGGMYHHLIKSAKVEAFEINETEVIELYVCSENGVGFQDKIDKFYLTKEEAEKALKGGAE